MFREFFWFLLVNVIDKLNNNLGLDYFCFVDDLHESAETVVEKRMVEYKLVNEMYKLNLILLLLQVGLEEVPKTGE